MSYPSYPGDSGPQPEQPAATPDSAPVSYDPFVPAPDAAYTPVPEQVAAQEPVAAPPAPAYGAAAPAYSAAAPAAAPVYAPAAAAVPQPPAAALPPTAWYPQSAPPAPQSAPPAPPRRGRTGIILLSISTALLLITTLAGAGLFLWKFNEADKLTTQSNQQSATIESKTKELETLRKDADDALREKGEQTSRAEDAEKRGDVLAKCLSGIYDVSDALREGNISKAEKLNKAANKACKAANKYL